MYEQGYLNWVVLYASKQEHIGMVARGKVSNVLRGIYFYILRKSRAIHEILQL